MKRISRDRVPIFVYDVGRRYIAKNDLPYGPSIKILTVLLVRAPPESIGREALAISNSLLVHPPAFLHIKTSPCSSMRPMFESTGALAMVNGCGSIQPNQPSDVDR